jgi:hypothetical protein
MDVSQILLLHFGAKGTIGVRRREAMRSVTSKPDRQQHLAFFLRGNSMFDTRCQHEHLSALEFVNLLFNGDLEPASQHVHVHYARRAVRRQVGKPLEENSAIVKPP